MRKYLMVEKTEEGVFLCVGKGTDPEPYDAEKHWHDWEEIENEDQLFDRIKEILDGGK